MLPLWQGHLTPTKGLQLSDWEALLYSRLLRYRTAYSKKRKKQNGPSSVHTDSHPHPHKIFQLGAGLGVSSKAVASHVYALAWLSRTERRKNKAKHKPASPLPSTENLSVRYPQKRRRASEHWLVEPCDPPLRVEWLLIWCCCSGLVHRPDKGSREAVQDATF